MFIIFSIFLLMRCSSAIAYGEPVFRDDYSYYEKVHGWLKLHTIPGNWHDARLRCIAEGASLVSPNDCDLRDVMKSIMIGESTDPSLGIYSGIHSTFSNGSYLTIEGIPISALPVSWVTGQPDNVYTENCITFHMNGTLEDVQCSKTFEFICYKKFANLSVNQCKTVDNDYNWDGRTGHCYKFHPFGQTWSRSHMICTAEGGYLAVINSDTEAQVLRDLFVKYPAQTLYTAYKDSAFVGIREWPHERSWYTVQGQIITETGYSRWNGDPDNAIYADETQDCGVITRDALYEDFWCSHQLSFICEKDV